MVHIDVECHRAIEMKFTGKCVELQLLDRMRVPSSEKQIHQLVVSYVNPSSESFVLDV